MEASSKNEIVVRIPEKEEALHKKKEPQMDSASSEGYNYRYTSSPSPEIKNSTPKSSKPPKIPTETTMMIRQQRLLSRSEFSKPKSRFAEPAYPTTDQNMNEMMSSNTKSNRNSPNMASPNNNCKITPSVTPRTPLIEITREVEDDDEDEEVYKTADLEVSKWSSGIDF